MPPSLFNYASRLLIRNAVVRPATFARTRAPTIHGTSRNIASSPSFYKGKADTATDGHLHLGGGKGNTNERTHSTGHWPIILATIPIVLFIAQGVQVLWTTGPSMTPYLNENYATTHVEKDVILVLATSPAHKFKRGMVVVFPGLSDPFEYTVKRIIALPGDRVTPRPDTARATTEPDKPQTVPWNHVWVEGDSDNSRDSFDSNAYGPISMSLIQGRVVCVLRPRPRMLRWEDWEEDEHGKAQRSRVEKDAIAVDAPPMA